MDASGPLSIAREDLAAGGDALALAAGAWPPSEREGQLAALLLHPSQFVLLSARCGTQLAAAMLAQQLAGKAAVIWPPQVAAEEPDDARLFLLKAMHAQLAAGGVQLAQALLEMPSGSPAELLRLAGYQHAGDLLYMAAAANSFPAEAPPLCVQLESYSPENHARFVAVVEASYRGSLDCPLVDGLRRTEDVLAGYQAVGQFRPDLWLLARNENRDIACLLVADHPDQEQSEIVYLGVVPPARGQGLGLALTRHALWLARQAGRARVVLAVDAANQPAIDGYLVAGFAAWDRRSVLVHSLRSPEALSC